MNLVFNKIGKFYFLRWMVAIGIIIFLIYTEEDWRGAHEWAATKAEWEAKGESFDRAKFIPPPVPDEQNLAALPLFKLERIVSENGKTYFGLATLRKAMRYGPPENEIPKLGTWSEGELPDMEKIRASIGSNYDSIFTDTKAPDSVLAKFDAIYPFLDELRTASASRPLFRLDLDYAIDPPYDRAFGPVVDMIRVSKLLTLHALLALHENQSNLALADLKLNKQFFAGVQRDPSLVGSLVAIGMGRISNAAIYEGLAGHLWSDAQLTELEKMLKPIDFLAEYQFAMRSELLFALGTVDCLRRSGHHSDLNMIDAQADQRTVDAANFFADGWWDINKKQMADFNFHEITAIDLPARRIYPNVAVQLKFQNDRVNEYPWNLFYSMMTGGSNLSLEKFAEGQVSVDETRIACALERYHLARGIYPATLAELAPAYIDEVPHDIMNGEPYHYRLNGDGTFLLYSVGWNQKDDGGIVVVKAGDPKTIDYEQGDWVWPTAKVVH